MPTFHHIQKHLRHYGTSNKPLYTLCGVALFYFIFDGILSYIAPLVITKAGYSETTMGLIIGSSSIAGMIFDFIICRVFPNTSFRRIFAVLFVLCAFYPLLLAKSETIWLFLLAMALWGAYFDLGGIGTMNFLGHHVKPAEQSSGSGIIQSFKGLGYLLASLIAGLVVGEKVGWKPLILAWIFLFISFIFFIKLLISTRNQKEESYTEEAATPTRFPLAKELRLWAMTIWVLRPILSLMIFITIYDSFFWTLGPLFAEQFPSLNGFEGVLVAAYQLPILVCGWFVGNIAIKVGKERTALYGFLAGSLLLAPLYLIQQPFAIMALVFGSSFFLSFSLPALNGICAYHIAKTPEIEKEIEGVNDMSINIGYIIGPMAAGLLADTYGFAQAFSIISVTGLLCGLALLNTTNCHLRLRPLSKYRLS